jgi:alkylation response protein AidB-like acyl-CoA dehydrogenase
VKDGAIYAQPFSEGGAAAAGRAPFGTLAAEVDGGWRINGKKIFASLAGAANYYGVLCTEDKPGRTERDTLYLAVPGDAPGLSVVGDWDPLGMRGTVSQPRVQGRVRSRRGVDDAARRLLPGREPLAAHVHDARAELHGDRDRGL